MSDWLPIVLGSIGCGVLAFFIALIIQHIGKD